MLSKTILLKKLTQTVITPSVFKIIGCSYVHYRFLSFTHYPEYCSPSQPPAPRWRGAPSASARPAPGAPAAFIWRAGVAPRHSSWGRKQRDAWRQRGAKGCGEGGSRREIKRCCRVRCCRALHRIRPMKVEILYLGLSIFRAVKGKVF